jgi:hypothetical protein
MGGAVPTSNRREIMRIEYFVKESDGRFHVLHTDENGETWDADPEGFDTEAEAEAFRAEVQDEEDGK